MFCFKRKGKQKIERKRIYLSLTALGLGPFFFFPHGLLSPSPFLLFAPAQRQLGPPHGPGGLPAPRTSSPFAAADDRAGPRSSVTVRWDLTVRTAFYLESEPVTSRVHQPRAIRAKKSRFRPIPVLYIPPRSSASPQFNPSHSQRVQARLNCRRDPPHHQSAAAAPSSLCERRAGLRFRRAKSRRPSFCALPFCIPC